MIPRTTEKRDKKILINKIAQLLLERGELWMKMEKQIAEILKDGNIKNKILFLSFEFNEMRLLKFNWIQLNVSWSHNSFGNP